MSYYFEKSKYAKSANIKEFGNQIFENIANEESAIWSKAEFNSGQH